MAFELTRKARLEADKTNVEPNLVLEIEGVSTIFGSIAIQKTFLYGDLDADGLPINYGDAGLVYGGLIDKPGTKPYISIGGRGGAKTTTSITQKLEIDKGRSSTISSMMISIADINEEVTQLISPNEATNFDLMGRRCKVYLGFKNLAFPDDFIIIHRGIIDEIGSGSGFITMNIAHPAQKLKSTIFEQGQTLIDDGAGIDAVVTTVTVDSTADFLTTVIGPGGGTDAAFIPAIRIDDEIIFFTGKTATTFTGLTRGALGTTAAPHDDDADVVSTYQLVDNVIDLTLKVLASGREGPFQEDVEIENFVRISASETVANSIFFQNVNVSDLYNLQVGDFITTTGASNGANNTSLKAISQIVITAAGSYIVVSGVAFVEEVGSAAVIDFRSKFDVFPDGAGLKLHNDEIDFAQFDQIKTIFLSSFPYDFLLQDSIQGKDFIEDKLMKPASAFSVPRKGQISIGFHSAPIPGTETRVIGLGQVLNPDKLKITRSTTKNFFNQITYRFDERRLEAGKFARIRKFLNATSITRIPVGIKEQKIDATGMRESLNAINLANSASNRKLKRYKFGAESIKGIQLRFKDGFDLEIGDIIVLDFAELKLTDIKNATRNGDARLVQIENKKTEIDGKITINVVDTDFDGTSRFCLVSPSSFIKSGISTTSFVIEESFASKFGSDEFRKWEDKLGVSVRVHNTDFSISGTAILDNLAGNTVTLATSLGFTPAAGQLMEFNTYSNQSDVIKAKYGFMSDVTFPDDGVQYQMI